MPRALQRLRHRDAGRIAAAVLSRTLAQRRQVMHRTPQYDAPPAFAGRVFSSDARDDLTLLWYLLIPVGVLFAFAGFLGVVARAAGLIRKWHRGD